jgi:KDO2-lipid IV(A) lauroyltransferase
MPRLAAAVLYAIAWSIARLPWSCLSVLANVVASCWIRLDAREARVARLNLELAMPQLDTAARSELQRKILLTTARQALETLRFWTRPHAENLALIRETHGVDLFDAAIARGNGVIVAAPHYGNWELLNQWLASHTALAILYRPPESAIGEAFLQRVRADGDGHVTQIRAEGAGVRQLFRLLQGGGVVGILPDQQPKVGDGVFAPFFGVQALTMTLLTRLAQRTGATVLFAYCERKPSSTNDAAFALRFELAPAGITAAQPEAGACALNEMVERIARRDPTQYQWTYKRYNLRPLDSGEASPYTDPSMP